MTELLPYSVQADWPIVSLREVTIKIGSGATPRGGSGAYLSKRANFGFVRSQNVFDRRFDGASLAFISDEQAAALRGVELRSGDVLLNITGDGVTFGRAALIDDDVLPACVNQHVSIIRADPRKAVPGFLLAYLTHPDVKPYIASFNSGGSRRAVTKGHIESFRLPLPPPEVQRAIAATLGALDGKIKSNGIAVEKLLALSAQLFRRWRITTPTESETTFGEFSAVFGGSTPKTTEPQFWGGSLAWTTPTDVTRLAAPYLFDTSRRITESGLQSCTAVMHPPGTILMTSRATIGAFAINQVAAATNQGFIAVRPMAEFHRWFLFEEMRSRTAEFIENANGSTFLEISRGRFKELPLSVPNAAKIKDLSDSLNPLHQKAVQLTVESARLASLRDTLLPELLAGRLNFPAAGETA